MREGGMRLRRRVQQVKQNESEAIWYRSSIVDVFSHYACISSRRNDGACCSLQSMCLDRKYLRSDGRASQMMLADVAGDHYYSSTVLPTPCAHASSTLYSCICRQWRSVPF